MRSFTLARCVCTWLVSKKRNKSHPIIIWVQFLHNYTRHQLGNLASCSFVRAKSYIKMKHNQSQWEHFSHAALHTHTLSWVEETVECCRRLSGRFITKVTASHTVCICAADPIQPPLRVSGVWSCICAPVSVCILHHLVVERCYITLANYTQIRIIHRRCAADCSRMCFLVVAQLLRASWFAPFVQLQSTASRFHRLGTALHCKQVHVSWEWLNKYI